HMSKWTAAEVKGSLGGKNFDNMSTQQQHGFAQSTISQSMKAMQQEGQMRGFKLTGDMGAQIEHEVSAQVFASIQKMDGEKKRDFPGFLAELDTRGQPRSGTIYQASKLDWSNPQGLLKSGQIPGMINQLSKMYAANFGTNGDSWRPISKEQSASLG